MRDNNYGTQWDRRQTVLSSKADLSAQWNFERSDKSFTVIACNLCGPLPRVLKVTNVRVKLAYRGDDKSLARPTSRCIFLMVRIFHLMLVLLYIYINSTNIPPIMIINRISGVLISP